jgi:hypothetical protein
MHDTQFMRRPPTRSLWRVLVGRWKQVNQRSGTFAQHRVELTARAWTRTLGATLFVYLMLGDSRAAIGEQFSIQCEWIQPYYVSFDTDRKRAVHESFHGQTALKGRISDVSASALLFNLVRAHTIAFELVWNEAEGTLTWIGLPDDPTGTTQVSKCHRTALRPLLSNWDRIPPLE